jgi:hypothetical protein
MGLIKSNLYFVIDYMLETINIYYLLFKNYNLFKIDASGSFNLLLNNENNNKWIQSAGNCYSTLFLITTMKNTNKKEFCSLLSGLILQKGSSETIRQLSSITKDKSSFNSWLAGIIDGDGNFDMIKDRNQNLALKKIRIKLHNRDIRILTRIQNSLHTGRIVSVKSKPYSMYIVSTKKEMILIINIINGLIRLKVDSFKKACKYFNIQYIESNYTLKPLDPYFAGLIDTDGSIVFNFSSNRIECNLELKYNTYSEKLNLDYVIPNCKPSILLRNKKNNTPGRIFKSIAFKYQTVSGMIHLYSYFIENRLYSDFKFYRVIKIKKFLEIREYIKYAKNSLEYKTYCSFILKWIKYKNPSWIKVPFVKKLIDT